MDKVNLGTGALALGLSVLLVASASAQVSQRIYFDVPFDFVAAEKTFPAGEYEIDWPSDNRSIVIRSTDHSKALIVLTNGVQSLRVQSDAKVVFHHYSGSPYFLSEAWKGDTKTGSLLPASPAERLLAKAAKQASVELAAATKESDQSR
jgi:hypothetical protein